MFRLRQSFEHLFESMIDLATEPRVHDYMRPLYDKLYYGSYEELNLLEHWRDEYRSTIQRIADAGTYRAQRAQMFNEIVKCTTWIALYEHVKRDDPPMLWNGFFKDEDRAFEEHFHFDILLRKCLIVFPTWVNLQVLGKLAFGLTADDEIGVKAYMLDREEYVECVVKLNRAQLTASYDRNESTLWAEMRPQIASIVDHRLRFNSKIKDALLNQNFKAAQFRKHHDRFVKEHSDAFKALGVTVD